MMTEFVFNNSAAMPGRTSEFKSAFDAQGQSALIQCSNCYIKVHASKAVQDNCILHVSSFIFKLMGALTFLCFFFYSFFLKLIVTCGLCVIYVREDSVTV